MTGVLKQSNIGFFRGLLALLLLASCAGASGAPPTVLNMNYHDARKVILQSGWQPADGLSTYDEISAVAHHFRDLGYSEVSDCAGAGATSPCIFYFQNKKGEYLKIGTEGEDNGLRLYPRVVYAAIRKSMD